MGSDNVSRIAVRDANAADMPALIAIKGDGTEALHRDRLRDAQQEGFRYLVLVVDETVIGIACLMSQLPPTWSDGGTPLHLPRIIDLQVQESHRGHGYGSEFVRALERITATAGSHHLYLGVDPLHNPRAYALYRRLGYQPLQVEPYLKIWEFTDSDGTLHRGEDMIVDMVKQVSA